MRKFLRKIKETIRWTFKYNLVIATPKTTYTIRHRIGRQPLIDTQTAPQKLRGASAKMVIFDEYVSDPLQESAERTEREYRRGL